MPSKSTESLIQEAEEIFKSNSSNNKKKNNVEAALNLAKLAQQQDPKFDGIDNFIAAYTIHAAAAMKTLLNGETDWYTVLGVLDPDSDTETIKKHYKKLALLVHPDKNASAAAEGAFKIVSAAWDLLSRLSARREFDERRRIFRPMELKVWPPPSSFWTTPTPAPSPIPTPTPMRPRERQRRRHQKCPYCGGGSVYHENAVQATLTCRECGFEVGVPLKQGGHVARAFDRDLLSQLSPIVHSTYM